MANVQISDKDLVAVPALTDLFLCEQEGVVKKITSDQILSNLPNMDAADALDGTEVLFCSQTTNKQITVNDLAVFIIGSS